MLQYHNDIDYEILNLLNDEDLYNTCYINKRNFKLCNQDQVLRNRLVNYRHALNIIQQYMSKNPSYIVIYFDNHLSNSEIKKIVRSNHGYINDHDISHRYVAYEINLYSVNYIYNSIKNIVHDLGYSFNPKNIIAREIFFNTIRLEYNVNYG